MYVYVIFSNVSKLEKIIVSNIAINNLFPFGLIRRINWDEWEYSHENYTIISLTAYHKA